MTLTEFLLARIAEDEDEAESWADDGRYGPHPGGGFWIDSHGRPIWSPRARVLAVCKAHRAIVEHHTSMPFADDPTKHYCRICDEAVGGWFPCDTLRDLASIYADHPDYPHDTTTESETDR